ncbi:hypothetical protein SBOR_6862 [Sclerotinia borealis F-4128]|uniref:Uncharacterized protein n=1 Tax=Sclerotinia borealis (strain F-4128) TaxID=1432307 RepID=W9CDX3_SCLBF|nr:hypothetical protein SBOR_6862 [Sclerotinia borealis F-4128]
MSSTPSDNLNSPSKPKTTNRFHPSHPQTSNPRSTTNAPHHQTILLLFSSSPYYTELQQMQKEYQTSSHNTLLQTQNSLSIYRNAVRTRSPMGIQAAQEMIDRNVQEMVEFHEEKKRKWDVVMERLAEDVGGYLGRVLKEVVREMNGRVGLVGSEMNLEGVLNEVGTRMYAEK